MDAGQPAIATDDERNIGRERGTHREPLHREGFAGALMFILLFLMGRHRGALSPCGVWALLDNIYRWTISPYQLYTRPAAWLQPLAGGCVLSLLGTVGLSANTIAGLCPRRGSSHWPVPLG